MVLAGTLRIVIKLFLVITAIFCFSCEDQGLFFNCSDCNTTEPLSSTLDVKLDASTFKNITVVKVYEGNLEDSVLYFSENVTEKEFTVLPVTLNKKYTVTATYFLRDRYYIAVDSATPKVRYDKKKCSHPCYLVYDKQIDLRLKYKG
jgi:hypothetical protein